MALAGMAHTQVVGLIPGWGVWEGTDGCFSVTSMFISLPSSLSKNNTNI